MTMIKMPFFRLIFFLILAIAFFHIIAIKFYFYWTVWWFDLAMHFAGGFWISLVVFWVLIFSGLFSLSKKYILPVKFFLVVSVFFTLFVGIAWEIFELWGGITFVSEGNYFLDTMGDLFMDVLGGTVASLYVFRIYKKRDRQDVVNEGMIPVNYHANG